MARGGARPGAGRPKGSKCKKETGQIAPDICKAARQARMTPLEYMLAVMNDPKADMVRRDRMAVAAAPFEHSRRIPAGVGKKEAANINAQTAGSGTEWEDLVSTKAVN